MTETLRLVLALLLAGAALTVMAAGWTWWGNDERVLARLIRKVLGGAADAAIISPGRGAAIAARFDTEQVLVLWNGGANALLYRLDALEGGELIIDDTVVARAWRGEPRRALDAINKDARQVTLRLVFDNPRDPEFVLDLWLPTDARRRDDKGPGPAITEARAWLARIEAILRRPRAGPVVQAAAAPAVARPPEPKPVRPPEPDEDEPFTDESGELPF